jgi:hypothetical protein
VSGGRQGFQDRWEFPRHFAVCEAAAAGAPHTAAVLGAAFTPLRCRKVRRAWMRLERIRKVRGAHAARVQRPAARRLHLRRSDGAKVENR